MAHDDGDWSLAHHIREVFEEQPRLRAARYGYPEDPDRVIARLVLRLLRNRHTAWGALIANHRRQLVQDRHLAVYLASVLAAGEAAVSEACRVARDINSTVAQFTIWRQWGQILVDADAAEDLDVLLRTTSNYRNTARQLG